VESGRTDINVVPSCMTEVAVALLRDVGLGWDSARSKSEDAPDRARSNGNSGLESTSRPCCARSLVMAICKGAQIMTTRKMPRWLGQSATPLWRKLVIDRVTKSKFEAKVEQSSVLAETNLTMLQLAGGNDSSEQNVPTV